VTKRADEAKADYLAGLSYKEIAERYNVSQSTVRNWKSRNHWDEDKKTVSNATDNATKEQNIATKRDKNATEELLRNDADSKNLTDKQKLFCA